MAMVVSSDRREQVSRPATAGPMRGVIDGLPTPVSMVGKLPAVLQEDDFCVRFVTAFDEAWAPIFATLDCWDSYLDAQLTPDDFVDWLASWVGVEIDETWTLERRRSLIQQVVSLYVIRGTAVGLAAHVGLYCGATPQIEESGGCIWSETADTPFPGDTRPQLTVRLEVDEPASVNARTVERIVAASRPAHLPFTVEIGAAGGGSPRRAKGRAGEAAAGDGDGAAAPDAPGAVDLPGSEHIELDPLGPGHGEDGQEGTDPSAPDGKEGAE